MHAENGLDSNLKLCPQLIDEFQSSQGALNG